MTRERIFPSKRDRWAAAMFWAIALSLVVAGIALAIHGESADERVTHLVVGLFGVVGVLWLWFTTRYRLTPHTLHLHSGPFHSAIPLRKIRAVTASRGGWGMSYALSLRAIQIDVEGSRYGYRISPEDLDGFMALIAERCDQLKWNGKELVHYTDRGRDNASDQSRAD